MSAANSRQRALNTLRNIGTDLGRRLCTIAFALFAVFFSVYCKAGWELRDTPVYDRGDVFFRADTRRAWRDMVGERLGSHTHTSGHPNFVILHHPIATGLTSVIKEWTRCKEKEAGKTASMVLTAAAGAGTVALFYLLLLANGLPSRRSALFSCVLGFSPVGLFYGAVPETYVFSALGLTAVAFLACRRTAAEPWWQLAAVYAWSALTTNIVLVGIWALVRYWERPLVLCAKRVAASIGITVLLTVALSLVQLAIYPKTVLFFHAQSVARESGWIDWECLKTPVEGARILLQHQWVSNIIAPEPERLFPFGDDKDMASIEAGRWEMFAPAWPLFALWAVVLAGAALGLFDRRFYTPSTLAALGVAAFNFGFFFVFGHDRMLYAALWTSVSVFLIASGWETLLKRVPALAKALPALLILLLAGQAWHNWQFLGKISLLVR